jgi:hypothetical protein
MSAPEIHIIGAGKKRRSGPKRTRATTGRSSSVDSLKRMRTGEPHVRLDDAGQSQHVQSFRHLFSFAKEPEVPSQGRRNSPNHEANIGGGETLVQGVRDRTMELDSNDDGEPNLGGKMFALVAESDDEVDRDPEMTALGFGTGDCGTDAAMINIAKAPGTASPAVPRPDVDDYVVHDGLASDDEADILALAMSFCGADKSVAELDDEWFNGGKREFVREDFRMKRMKRLRSRVQSSS